jgi:predicted GIY-YIG superfamily endonuclease
VATSRTITWRCGVAQLAAQRFRAGCKCLSSLDFFVPRGLFHPLLYQLSYQAARGRSMAARGAKTAGFAAKQGHSETAWRPFFSDVSSAISVEVVAAVHVRKNKHQLVARSTANDACRPRNPHAAGGQDGQVAFGQQPLAVGHRHGEQGVRRADVAELDQGHVGVVLGHLDAF